MTTYIYLNSVDAVDSFNPADSRFAINFFNYGDAKTIVGLEQTIIPLVVPPVSSSNNVLILEEDNGAHTNTITLDQQGFSGNELAIDLKSRMDSVSGAGNTFSVTYNSNTKKLTIISSGTNWRFQPTGSTGLKVVGFTDQNEAYSVTHVSDSVVRLDGSTYYDLYSSFASRNISSNGRTNILARIPITASFGAVQTYEPAQAYTIPISNRDIDQVSLFLVDDEGNRVIFPQNAHISYVFKLSFE